MNKSNIITLLMPVILLITACGTKCPDFNSSILDWMPYKKGDSVILNRNNSRDTFLVTSSEVYHTGRLGFMTKCECSNFYNVALTCDSINIAVSFNDSGDPKHSSISINNEYMEFSELLDNLMIGNVNYTNVIIYKSDRFNDSNQYEKIIISKSLGIIDIVGKNEERILHNKTEKNIKIQEVNFKSSDCGN